MKDISTGLKSRPAPFTYFCVLAGTLAPILFVIEFTLAGLFHPNYSAVNQTISELGAIEPNTWIQNTSFIILGLLMMIFVIGFYQVMQPVMKRGLVASCIFLMLAGIGFISAGIFPTFVAGDMPSTVSEFQRNPGLFIHGILHGFSFLLIIISLVSAFLIVGARLRKASSWRGSAWYSVITALLTVILMILFLSLLARHDLGGGVLERVLVIVALAWYTVLGQKMLRMI
ncbi:MAG TPA: DUF998 domain-containing protein [Ktedonobacteraceae bacterium]|nr:DUF998 domain-containing protein [Ktedonobacteraceae bacterium]